MTITPTLLTRVAALEQRRDVLLATIHESRAQGCFSVFGADAVVQLPEVERELDGLLFAMLALDTLMEAH